MAGFADGFAIVIGVANYPLLGPLPGAVLQDARDIEATLCSPDYCGYLEGNVRRLEDAQATAADIRAGLAWLAQAAPPDSTALVFFSGHGWRIEAGPRAGSYLLPYDCDPRDVIATAISGEELVAALANIRAQRLLAFFDCCHAAGIGKAAGPGFDRAALKIGLDERYYERLVQGTGRVIMASSRSDERSWVLSDANNSLFTACLLAALRGAARTQGDGLVRVFDVFDYISREVPRHASQHPIFKAADLEDNFPIALFMGGDQGQGSKDTAIDKRALREALIQHFSLEDLDILLADVAQDLAQKKITLQLNLETAGGQSKAGKVHNLIEHLDQRRLLSYLVAAARRARPGLI